MRGSHSLVFLLLVFLAGCASREVLVPKDAAAPTGVDFSGYWKLRDDVNEQQRRINDAIRQTDGVDERDLMRPLPGQVDERRTRQSRNRGGLVHVFLEYGKRLKITQTNAGLFISFDRAIVEEYRFGENREVQVGPVIADRVSGWDGADYVVETLDQNAMKLVERLRLQQNGEVLQRTITLRGRNMEQKTIVQLFDRE